MSFSGKFVTVLAAAVVLYPSLARPCSPPQCLDPARVTPHESVSIPANAPSVVLLNNHFFGGPSQDPGIELLKPDGGSYQADVVFDGFGWVITPAEPFVAGAESTLRFGRTCENHNPNVDAGTEPFEARIPVGADTQPLPTNIGTLELVEVGEEDLQFLNSCGGPAGRFAFARLKIVPSAEMQPWMPLARWTLSMDGAAWARTTYGVSTGSVGFATRSINEVHAQCPVQPDGGVTGGDPGLNHGRHQARLEAHIAGVDAGFDPVFLEIPLVCDAGTPPDGKGPLDGYDQLPATGCGCAASGSAATGMWPLLALLASVYALRRRGLVVAKDRGAA